MDKDKEDRAIFWIAFGVVTIIVLLLVGLAIPLAIKLWNWAL